MHTSPDKFISENDIVTWDALELNFEIFLILFWCSYYTKKGQLFWGESKDEWATKLNEKAEETERKLDALIELLDSQEWIQISKTDEPLTSTSTEMPASSNETKNFSDRYFENLTKNKYDQNRYKIINTQKKQHSKK